MKVVVLAAGFATRLYPLTLHTAKPLLELGGRPVLDHILETVTDFEGASGVVIVHNARFAEAFAAWAQGYRGSPVTLVDNGVHEEPEKLGGAGDMLLGLEAAGDEDVLVLGGDNILCFDVAPHVERLRAERVPLMLACEVPEPVPPGRYGEVNIDAAGRITEMREKPAEPRTNLAASCFYLFPAGMTALLRRYLDEGGKPDPPGCFIQWLVTRTEVRVTKASHESLFDIGNEESLERARARFGGGTAPPVA